MLLVYDHASIRRSLRYLLESTYDIQVVATAASGSDAVAQTSSFCPDVAVIDISMPQMDGIETTRLLRQNCRSTRVLMLSIYNNPEYIQRSLEVGAQGYILKDKIGDDLIAGIRAVEHGKRYFSQQIAELAQSYLAQLGDRPASGQEL